jgi:hypothetical protein
MVGASGLGPSLEQASERGANDRTDNGRNQAEASHQCSTAECTTGHRALNLATSVERGHMGESCHVPMCARLAPRAKLLGEGHDIDTRRALDGLCAPRTCHCQLPVIVTLCLG